MMTSVVDYLWNARKAILAALGAAITAYAAGAGWPTVVIAALTSGGVVYAVPNKALPVPTEKPHTEGTP
jgi:hypothetical protein